MEQGYMQGEEVNIPNLLDCSIKLLSLIRDASNEFKEMIESYYQELKINSSF